MPIYDFSCRACGRPFEELVRSDTVVACLACGSRRVERLLSLPARPVTAGRPMPADRHDLPPGGGCCGGACRGLAP